MMKLTLATNDRYKTIRREPQYVPVPSAKQSFTYDLLVGRVYGNTRMDTFWAFRQA